MVALPHRYVLYWVPQGQLPRGTWNLGQQCWDIHSAEDSPFGDSYNVVSIAFFFAPLSCQYNIIFVVVAGSHHHGTSARTIQTLCSSIALLRCCTTLLASLAIPRRLRLRNCNCLVSGSHHSLSVKTYYRCFRWFLFCLFGICCSVVLWRMSFVGSWCE